MSTQMTPSPSKPQRAASPDWPQNALPPHWIDSLLTKFEVYYGDKFHRQWANVPRDAMRKQWAVDLGKLSREELAAGVEALKHAEWPPTLPEFISLCRPSLDYTEALYEAVEQMRKRAEGKDQWSRPEIYWAAVNIGQFDLLNMAHDDLIKRFTVALKKVMESGQCEPVPPRMTALPAPGQGVADKEKVEREVAKIRATQKQVGNKDWAHRILEREKRDKVPYMVGKMARMALGIKEETK